MRLEGIAPGQELRFQQQINQGLLLRMLQVPSVVTEDDSPLLKEMPSACGQVIHDTAGTAYVVPVAVVPARSKVSRTSAVFLERDAAGAWALAFWIDLVRPDQGPGADPAVGFFPVAEISVSITSAVAGVSSPLATVTDLPPPDDSVLRRLSASMPVRDPAAVANALREDESVTLHVVATLHYRQPGVEPAPEPPDGPHQRWFDKIYLNRAFESRVRLVPQADSATRPALDLRTAGLDTRVFRLPPELLRLPDPPPPTSAATAVALTPDALGLSAFRPTKDPANRPIYYRFNVSAGGDAAGGDDPDAVWVPGGHGLWRESPVPNQYFVLPTEYRLDVDAERGLPAMSVLLIELPPDAAHPEAGYKVRLRFQLVPWFDPVEVELLRAEIADAAGVPWPELVVGGTDQVTYSASDWLSGLGGVEVAAAGPAGRDPRGFEHVLDASFSFYTLVANLLAPADGPPTGLEGTVTFSLRTSADETAPRTTRTVPAHLRLDRPTDDFLVASFAPAPLPPDDTWPEGWRPPLYTRVHGLPGLPATVAGGFASLLVLDPISGRPIDRAPATLVPVPFDVPGLATSPVLPPPDPTAPEGARAPDAQPGEVLLRLEQPAAGAIDPRVIGGASVTLTGVTVHVDARAMLEKVHATASAAGLATQLRVSSYQLKHPEVLPPALADLFQLDVEFRRGTGDPSRVSLTRDEPQATTALPFTLDDVVAGLRPDQPTFEFRRRNVTPAGEGSFSDWESVVGGTLLVTPVTRPGAAAPG